MSRGFRRRTALMAAAVAGVGVPALGLGLMAAVTSTATASTQGTQVSAQRPQAATDASTDESGRRDCVYHRSVATNPDGSSGIETTVFVDWKKRGACPTVDPIKFKEVTGVDLQGPQSVDKITCENAVSLLRKNPWGVADICTQMIDNYVYKFVYDPAKDRITWTNYGSAESSIFVSP